MDVVSNIQALAISQSCILYTKFSAEGYLYGLASFNAPLVILIPLFSNSPLYLGCSC